MLDYQRIESYRENNRIEAKLAAGGLPKSLWETYSAFANTLGGVILLGVAEDKEDKSLYSVPLFDPRELVEEFWAMVNAPDIVSANILQREDVQILKSQGNPVVAIFVPRAPARLRPVYIGSDPIPAPISAWGRATAAPGGMRSWPCFRTKPN